MPTIRQLISKCRKKKQKKNLKKALMKCPQKKGVCMKILTRSPKKPNSAQRKVVRVRLSNKKIIFAHVPGEGHNLNPFSVVLVRGGNVKDLPSVRYKTIRGVKDLEPIYTRMNGRSKYGTKKPKVQS
jgi:small subunit ribosomal protein S12